MRMPYRFKLFVSTLQTRLVLYGSGRYKNRLNRFEYRTYSQHGEDGILAEIFRRIGTTNRQFVEFGAGEGWENNTAYLAAQGWRGFWLEGNETSVKRLQRNKHAGSVIVKRAFITAENINQLFEELGVPQELDLLSIDIDGNDYWVWKAITRKPRVMVVEYNPYHPKETEWIMPYNPEHVWKKDRYYGASLRALELLGAQKGYALVGCDMSGTNAFFIRNDLSCHFTGPFSAGSLYEPARPYCRARSAPISQA